MRRVASKFADQKDAGRVRQLFYSLIGRWQEKRTIAPGGTFTGIAIFEPSNENTIHYHEEGVAELEDGNRVPGFRNYVFRLEGDEILVYFDEKPLRLFHVLQLKEGRDGTTSADTFHRCAADDYVSTYTFLNDRSFEIVHRVSGPRKSYVMVTNYSRL